MEEDRGGLKIELNKVGGDKVRVEVNGEVVVRIGKKFDELSEGMKEDVLGCLNGFYKKETDKFKEKR